ncbi:hypothetical protein MIND_01197000 [Mycena indigotica]|uniref:Uncharacterized protein n=1 Tax=Mycena indigotica TaxID=2126181 RepID=A0A8H6S708_9AGAR|nr:uncharacterized protein MIND_01197000 [Mycena indigotica]KAF7292977.1 hypothetical protein MIND_01197000 [Mycena indigotica]
MYRLCNAQPDVMRIWMAIQLGIVCTAKAVLTRTIPQLLSDHNSAPIPLLAGELLNRELCAASPISPTSLLHAGSGKSKRSFRDSKNITSRRDRRNHLCGNSSSVDDYCCRAALEKAETAHSSETKVAILFRRAASVEYGHNADALSNASRTSPNYEFSAAKITHGHICASSGPYSGIAEPGDVSAYKSCIH